LPEAVSGFSVVKSRRNFIFESAADKFDGFRRHIIPPLVRRTVLTSGKRQKYN
jgi:hypothetical protein